ncbi:UNVERIFIED_CONTAM: hypothetical protein Slati_0510300 [Sesamum latifolium]|uniref:Uncharacterized protein n=1 Tax=Sesamum latifolium TaxID=2727402 RepID=A0AAW2Y0M8_9LAMI
MAITQVPMVTPIAVEVAGKGEEPLSRRPAPTTLGGGSPQWITHLECLLKGLHEFHVAINCCQHLASLVLTLSNAQIWDEIN